MNGAESLVRTLIAGGIDTCFANPGTSEMHFVAALDRVAGMRCILGLFEGVVSGAADGYGRMADKPAATLLHLGPGLGNALANLHNARKACTPMVNIVGDHATHHRQYDAPLTADVEGVARPMSDWVKTSMSARDVARDGAEAIAAALAGPGQVATLILPADTAWGEANGPAPSVVPPSRRKVPDEAITEAVAALRSGERTLILIGGRALRAKPIEIASRIAKATNAGLLAPTSNARIERGAGRVILDRIFYPLDQALEQLRGYKRVILVGAANPVAFFAYPGKPSLVLPPDCKIHVLAEPQDDLGDALERLAAEVGADAHKPLTQNALRPTLPKGALTAETIAAVVGALLPENAIVVDESINAGGWVYPLTAGSPAHDWLQLTGGSIGIGLPLATGAAVACPDRRVVALQADGSGMYTLQALWTQAREKLNVTNIIFSNRAYASLETELRNVGALNPGRIALDMLDLSRPDLDWVKLAEGMGVEAARADTIEKLIDLFQTSTRRPGPFLIEVPC
ncbi:acetolactate synthase large subunit [Microvirga brassicacearum]|uniref:Acetolactate synthase large subunit n=1 Tax=Microvirga brassicacearum TaxID=2580413 RepID=A0A5N3P6U7_9HYPH|nr:acetolactate synthase large subunit [Microvirga brassicacearum]KAB0265446.1 acetolactate synthase large subunit [Microvirga brassicacearum]